MTLRFPENILEEILNRVNIVELIAGYIPLKKAGRNFKANCPFHHEKTPSFVVSPDKAIFHCFGCSCGGNAFSFLMRYEHLEFREAVEFLAKKSGVTLPVLERDDGQVNILREIYQANELAAEFYHNNLLQQKSAEIARKYLVKRKINPQTAKIFKLGFAPDNWDSLLNYLRQNKINLKTLEKSGLVVAKDNGGFYDRFRNRIIFSIFDVKSRVIGFGARAISDATDKAKYINSPETPVYVKGNNLFGLNFSKASMIDNDKAIVVEGYMDMISPFQEGIDNIVAASGTALTVNQIRLLKRYSKNITVVFDADNAGQLATLRSLDLFIEEDIHVRVAVLPEGFDPDSFLREKGKDAFNLRLENSAGLFDYKLSLLLKRFDDKSIEGKAQIAREMIPTLNKFKDRILKSEYMKKLSQILNVDEAALLGESERVRDKNTFLRPTLRLNKTVDSDKPALEKMILKLMFQDMDLVSLVKKEIDLDDFRNGELRDIAAIIFELEAKGKTMATHQLMNFFSSRNLQQIISELSFDDDNYSLEGVNLSEREKMLNECLKRIKLKRFDYRKKILHEQIVDAQGKKDEQAVGQLLREYNDLIKSRSDAV